MEDPTGRKIKILIGLVIFTLLSLFILILYIFYLISQIITSFGSILLFIFCLHCILKLIVRLSVFPGSFWLWKRSIESHFCREMCLQLLQKVQDLRICLEILLDKSSDCEKVEFFERAIEATTYSKRMISTIIETYEIEEKNKTLTKQGATLFSILKDFQCSLQVCRICSETKSESIWDFIDEAQDDKDWQGLVSEDYPKNESITNSHTICLNLESRLLESCGNVNIFNKVKRWLFDSTLGTYDQMRLELQSRYDCEPISLQIGKILIDCMYVTAPEAQDPPTIILCNPNAGLYEFALYQSEWLEYYVNSGINVFLWNYRGYGRSTGSPDPESMKKDAESIVEFLRDTKKVKLLGIHGESLGGIVATHIARIYEVDFLFVDRSFDRLNEVVKYSFGKWATVIMKLVSRWDTNSALDYLYVNCYKIISADPQDNMINDLVSLKSGVAIRLIETRGLEIAEGIKPARLDIDKYYHILNQNDTGIMVNALNALMEFAFKYNKNEERNSGIVDLTNTSNCELVAKYSEGNDDEIVNNLLCQVFTVLDNLDAGGKLLSSVLVDKNKELSMKLWLMVLDVWGSFLPVEPAEINMTRARALEKLVNSVRELKEALEEHEYSSEIAIVDICRETKNLEKCLSKIIVYLRNQVFVSDKIVGDLSPGREEISTFRHHFEYEKAGYLLPLSCGHSGRYDQSELSLLETHLVRIGFLKVV
ncbi:hypothetical protein SteCoe_21119 [Stentor coeruleus]|uniref:Serine aminopeptidase S33 domain-containing protein n=1 Tax=Stentor coeruleus TaxID=5963 RepID=A0A1R2BQE0_9CILI|nr:hypothetical protein SteCoe_21119 [Stentor coeruleus]